VRLLPHVAIAVAVVTASWGLSANDQLNGAIGRPNRALYRSVHDARDWQNPIIIVQDDGVEVRARGIDGRRHVSVDDLKGLLISLPVSAWPYGRVVAQTDQGILPVPWEDYVRRMATTRTGVAIILKDLDITAELWPS